MSMVARTTSQGGEYLYSGCNNHKYSMSNKNSNLMLKIILGCLAAIIILGTLIQIAQNILPILIIITIVSAIAWWYSIDQQTGQRNNILLVVSLCAGVFTLGIVLIVVGLGATPIGRMAINLIEKLTGY